MRACGVHGLNSSNCKGISLPLRKCTLDLSLATGDSTAKPLNDRVKVNGKIYALDNKLL